MTDKDIENKSSKPLLDESEEKFFTILKYILNDKYIINYKTKLSDIIELKEWLPKKDFDTYTKQHIDFVICDKEIPSIVKLLIEYDDPSHSEKDAIKRDKLKDKVIGENPPFLRFDDRDSYENIKIQIEKELNSSSQTKEKFITKSEVYIDESQIIDSKQISKDNRTWNKLKGGAKDFFIEKGIPAIGIIIVFFIVLPRVIPKILFQNTLKNIQPIKTIPKIDTTPYIPSIPKPQPTTPYENKILIPAQPQIPKENIITSPKIKVKIRIAGKYISENINYVMYERMDTRKQKNVTITDFLKMCECSDTELYTDRLMEIFEYP